MDSDILITDHNIYAISDYTFYDDIYYNDCYSNAPPVSCPGKDDNVVYDYPLSDIEPEIYMREY